MSKTISEAMTELQEEITRLEEQLRSCKLKVNFLCQIEGAPEVYADVDTPVLPTNAKTVRLRPDQFTAFKLAKAVRCYLEMRKETNPDNAPASIEEIRAALHEGSFDFRGKDPMQALSISIGKSTHTFKRLSNGKFGLQAWYGGTPRPSKAKAASNKDEGETEEADDEQDDATETAKGNAATSPNVPPASQQ